MKKLRVLFAGGGTAGHINPALTMADALKELGADIAFAGTPGGLESDLVPRAGYPLHTVRVRPLPRRLNLDLIRSVADAGIGLGQAFRMIRRLRPDVVVGTGGYVAGPVLLAAVIRRVPTVIHEQNAFPGGTNRALARWVDRVALGYQEAATHFKRPDKLVFVGNPIRAEFMTTRRSEAIKRLKLAQGLRTIIIFGGSRGARSINQAVFAARSDIHALRDVQVIHQTGAAGFPGVVEAYREIGINPVDETHIRDGNIKVVPYLYDMPAAMAAADLVVSRSGALSVAEITARGVPSILIPYPYATADHQTFNARPLVDAGAARLIRDQDLDGTSLATALSEVIHDTAKMRTMGDAARRLGRPEAVRDLVKLIEAVATEQA